AHALFRRLHARAHLVNVDAKVGEPGTTYLAVGSEWRKAIESPHAYTFGRGERVADHAPAVARQRGRAAPEPATTRAGAHLPRLGGGVAARRGRRARRRLVATASAAPLGGEPMHDLDDESPVERPG